MAEKQYKITDPERVGLGRGFKFEAGHILAGYDGKCARPHGHSYHGFIMVSVPRVRADAVGIVLDFDIMALAISDCIFRKYDHLTITETVEALVFRFAEDLQAWFNEREGQEVLAPHEGDQWKTRRVPKGCMVEKVVCYETANSFARWVRNGY